MKYKIIFAIIISAAVISLFFTESKPLRVKEKLILSDTVQIEINKEHLKKSNELHKYFKRRHEKIGFNGAVLFAEDGEVVYKNAFGYLNFRSKEKNKIDTKFQIASVSKPFTSYAIMLLKQEGELSYEDSVQHYFPKFPYKGISIRHLLIHQSGLPEYFYFADKLWKDKNHPISNMDVVELLIDKHPQRYYLPGKKYNYINTNYCLLAAIVEEITGDTFEEFMEEEIFEELSMNDTFIYNKDKIENPNVAIGYTKRRRKAEDTFLNGVVGDKGIYTTVEDMLKFDQALYNGNPLDLEVLVEAFEPAHKRLYKHDNYGFGWRINASDEENKIVYHTGWWKGFRSYFIRQLGKRKTIIVLSNTSHQSIFGTRDLIKLF